MKTITLFFISALAVFGQVTTINGTDTVGNSRAIINTNFSNLLRIPRSCTIQTGSDNGAALVDADIAPQKHQCYVPHAATITEIRVTADAGTPSVLLQRRRGGTTVADLMSGSLVTAAAGAAACVKSTISTPCADGTASSSTVTLSNTALAAGDEIETKTATAGGTAKAIQIHIVWTVN